MGVYIKGMEMPNHCGYCRFRYDGICHALQKTQYSMEDCPLVAVPSHGDLIDSEEVAHEIWCAHCYECKPDEIEKHCKSCIVKGVIDLIVGFPSVIPAERGE